MKGETNNPLQLVRVWQGCFANRFFICARTCIYKMHLDGYADYYTRSSSPCDHKMHSHRFKDARTQGANACRDAEIAAKCFYDLGNTWMVKADSLNCSDFADWLKDLGMAVSGKACRSHPLPLSLHLCGNACGAERPKLANPNQHSGKFISMHICNA